MRLVSVYDNQLTSELVLFDLLRERTPEMSISHQEMPTWAEHAAFVQSHPYEAWYLIEVDGPDTHRPWSFVGAIYLTDAGEIGVFLFEHFHGRGHGSAAVRLLMKAHPRERFLANVSPRNGPSQAFFTSLGFRPIQHTYELRS